MTKKINFRALYRKFKFKVIRYFLLTILWTILNVVLFGAIVALFRKEQIPAGYNYAEILIPEKIRQWSLFRKLILTQKQFIAIGLGLVIGYALIHYWNYLWEEELRVRGERYTKNLLLNKFRRLPFEEKQRQKDQVGKLIENDSWEIGHYWAHIPNHIFHSALMIIGYLFFYWGRFEQMTGQAVWFSVFCLGLLNITVFFFTRRILRNEKKYKNKSDQEWAIINKERSNINLIENMGLMTHYEAKQKKITHENEKLALDFNRTKSLSKTIPNNLLIDAYIFILLLLSGDSFNGVVLFVFWEIFTNFRSIFQCLWDYAEYASSRSRINTFLELPEKDDNLKGVELNPQFSIKSIKFENVSFRYAGQKEWIIRNYTHTFSPGKLNSLRGKNGTGKSTKLYLLLGVIKPQEGKIIIELKNKQTHELHQNINLATWRANNVAYCVHETLVEEGSTGQKQLANINQALATKKDCQIFLFDEADNALDEDNQKEFREKIKELAKDKLIIYIKH